MLGTDNQQFNDYFQPKDSPIAQKPVYFSANKQDNLFEYKPNAQPNVISKGTLNTTAGGILTLYDKTGGTKILTYDPASGVVTILGSLIAQSVTTGTYTSITLAGMGTVLGTQVGGVYGTALYQGGTFANGLVGTSSILGGTINPGTYQINGTAGVTGSFVYVKTVNFAGSTTTLGTVLTTSGLITTIS